MIKMGCYMHQIVKLNKFCFKVLKAFGGTSRSPSTGEAETGELRIWGQPGLLTLCENRNRLLSPSAPVAGLPSRLYKNGQLELDGVWDGTVPGSPSLGGCHMVLSDCQILCLLQNHGCSFYPVTKLTLLCPVWGNTSSISPALSTPLPPVAWLPCLCVLSHLSSLWVTTSSWSPS